MISNTEVGDILTATHFLPFLTINRSLRGCLEFSAVT